MSASDWITVRVNEIWDEAQNIRGISLVPTDRDLLPGFTPGSHIDVQISEKLIRQYSLVNSNERPHRYLIAVLRETESRGGSEYIHSELKVGDELRISSPRNHFHLKVGARKSILLAGGIGVTPILSMANRLAAEGDDFEMHYFAKSESACAFVNTIRTGTFSDKVHFHFDDQATDAKSLLGALLNGHEVNTPIYICGPGGFIDFVIGKASAHGWNESAIHREYFVAPDQQDDAEGAAFRIKVASTGDVFTVGEDETIVEVLDNHGIEVPVSCEQGICGTCLTRVLEGTPDHRDMFLTDEEHSKNDQMTVCCSRAKSEMLTLDL